MNTSPGPGYWMAADGRWYPSQQPYGVFGPKPKRTPAQNVMLFFIRLLLVVLLVGGGFAGGYFYFKHKNAATTVSSVIQGTSMTVAQLNASVLGEIGNQNAQNVTSITCIPPPQWTSGAHFSCVGFGTAGTSMGTYSAIVAPSTASGVPQWIGNWTGS